MPNHRTSRRITSLERNIKLLKCRIQSLSDQIAENANAQVQRANRLDTDLASLRAELHAVREPEQGGERHQHGRHAHYHDNNDGSIDFTELDTILASFSADCHKLAMDYGWMLNPISAGDPAIPHLRSASAADMLMRCAALETVIGQALVDHVFVKLYLSEEEKQQHHNLLRTLDELESENDEMSRRARRRLLGGYNPDGPTYTITVERAVEDVLNKLGALCFDSAADRAAFSEELTDIFEQGVDLWIPVQKHSGSRVHVEMNSPDAAWSVAEDSYKEDYGKLDKTSVIVRERPQTIIPLFPQLVTYQEGGRHDGRRNLIFHGWALWSRQSAFARASEEADVIHRWREGYRGVFDVRTCHVSCFCSPRLGDDKDTKVKIEYNAGTAKHGQKVKWKCCH